MSNDPPFQPRTVTIVGVGLIGGSLGLALKRRGVAETVIGVSRDETLTAARELGVIDDGYPYEAMAEGVAQSDLVVLCTPIARILELLPDAMSAATAGAIVCDVGSTKREIVTRAESLPHDGVHFIGGHPMAGSEKTGLDAATPNLFQRATYCIVAPPGAPAQALERVKGMAVAVGAAPLVLEADEHDYLVAGISHLPLLVAVVLVRAVAGDSTWPAMRRLASTGFRDTSRLASGSPEMGRDMCLTNKDTILAWLERFRHELDQLRCIIEEGDNAVEEVLVQAQDSRERWLEEKGW